MCALCKSYSLAVLFQQISTEVEENMYNAMDKSYVHHWDIRPFLSLTPVILSLLPSPYLSISLSLPGPLHLRLSHESFPPASEEHTPSPGPPQLSAQPPVNVAQNLALK